MDQQESLEQLSQPKKKIKLNESAEEQNQGWIVVKKKDQISISISNFEKLNKYYSHTSIQKYLRYLITQSCPNPMWLSIRKQSLIQHYVYIDLQIENNMFESMLQENVLQFLASKTNESNKAIFKQYKMIGKQLWQYMLCRDEDNIEQNYVKPQQEIAKTLTNNLYLQYKAFILTQEQLKNHQYPTLANQAYLQYFFIPHQKLTENKVELKNKILVADCEMVISQQGFELARATFINFDGQVIFDQLFKPSADIINYNTTFSGITHQMLSSVTNTLQNKLYPFLQSNLSDQTILVGHSLENDLRAMKFIHEKVIDTSVLFMRTNGTKHKLKSLADRILKRKIQTGSHDSIEDCKATLDLLKSRVQLLKGMKKKQYSILREFSANGKKALLIDYAIDYQMKENNSHHYEKVGQRQAVETIFKLMKKYMRKDISNPDIILTRIQKQVQQQWEDYYQNFDKQFKLFYEILPINSVIFLNCQINPYIQIADLKSAIKPQSKSRPFCIILTK